MSSLIDDQIKNAQHNNLIIEAQKLESEIKKIKLETAIAKKNDSQKWAKHFFTWLITFLLGVSILATYAEYAVVPWVQRNNIKLEIEIGLQEKKLIKLSDSLEAQGQRLTFFSDSVLASAKIIARAQDTNNAVKREVKKLQGLINNYKSKEILASVQKNKCLFKLFEENGTTQIEYFAGGNIVIRNLTTGAEEINKTLEQVSEEEGLNMENSPGAYLKPGIYKVTVLLVFDMGGSVREKRAETTITVGNSPMQIFNLVFGPSTHPERQ
jgi:hypothetical protein